ncbi:MAG: glycosyltransferase [Eubacteriales bacterium]
MGKILSSTNLKKAYYYMKKNGMKKAVLGVAERIQKPYYENYRYINLSKQCLEEQKNRKFEREYTFSIVVPAYETNQKYLEEMIDSVLEQTYPKWELILADASTSDQVERVTLRYQDERIRYIRLEENLGIAANTNEGIKFATGDYICLLDHDDFITNDALYEFQQVLEASFLEKGLEYAFVYSDEDKSNSEGERFYEPHFKLDFNLDLLTTNNYICHFLCMKTSLMQQLKLRPEYDGAQDFDLVLRAVATLLMEQRKRDHGEDKFSASASVISPLQVKEITGFNNVGTELPIKHIAKVLYHWRCHEGSTAANPASKRYAYEAGKKAIEDFFRRKNCQVEVQETAHVGFYRVEYGRHIFKKRKDLGLIGGKVIGNKNIIIGGIYEEDGTCMWDGMKSYYSGYMHRASLQQNCQAIDVRNMVFPLELEKILKDIFLQICSENQRSDWQPVLMELLEVGKKKSIGYDVCYQAGKNSSEKQYKDWNSSCISREEWKEISIRTSRKIRKHGYYIMWDPKL